MGSFGRSKDDSKALEAMRRNTRLGIAAVAPIAHRDLANPTGGHAGVAATLGCLASPSSLSPQLRGDGDEREECDGK